MASRKPIGTITRGTTNPNRLRRIDRFIASQSLFKNLKTPIVVDLGYGASPITSLELLARLKKVNSKTHVIGIEIDEGRVSRGLTVANSNLHFLLGGFEVPIPEQLGDTADLIRAFNVLRQYDESQVPGAWQQMQSRLSKDGLLIEGTCDEIGRLSSWITLDKNEAKSFTISLRLQGLDLPSKVAERLPKALIHRNIAGEKIYDFLLALDRAWLSNASLIAFGATQRWIGTCKKLQTEGWPLVGEPKRWRLGELSIEWSAVSPDKES